jgi:cytochrome c biogenesis protein CcmG, thiol:disulfide interchange protein DsbE
MRRAVPVLACVLLMGGCGSSEPKSAAPKPNVAKERLAGSPAPLASLHSQANRLLGGGPDAFKARLRALRGHPVVVNKWASWCGPCRLEFPFFQRLSIREGRRIAFLGVDANDNDADAKRFLGDLPLSYPSYRDPDLKVSAVFNGVAAFPTTAFYDRRGKLSFIHQGGYATERKLDEDIARYAR